MSVKAIPSGHHSVTPYIIVDNAQAALAFYHDALGAEELMRLPMTDKSGNDKIGHAEIRVGDSQIMLSDEWPDMGALGPKSRGGTTASFVLYVEDVDKAFDRAVKAGAKVDKPVTNEFWGDRMGSVIDPFGHKWSFGTHVEDVSPEEMRRRMMEMAKQQTH